MNLFLGAPCVVRGADDYTYTDAAWYYHPTAIYSSSHVHAVDAWERGYTGAGVTIGYSGSAPNISHVELEEKLNREMTTPKLLGSPFNVADNRYSADMYRTNLVSLSVGAKDNNVCTHGLAYGAMYAITASEYTDLIPCHWFTASGDKLPQVEVIDFGGKDDGLTLTAALECVNSMKSAADKGSIIVTASGNGGAKDNCNYDHYASNPFSIAVSGYSADHSVPSYNEMCAATVVSAPGGTRSVPVVGAGSSPASCAPTAGSQVAASLAGGAVAILKQADMNLSLRGARRALIKGASHPPQYQWVEGPTGFRTHDYMGHGLLNVTASLDIVLAGEAEPEREMESYLYKGKSIDLRDGGLLSITIPITGTRSEFLEDAQLVATISHQHTVDLEIDLISPAGTRSRFASPRNSAPSTYQRLMNFNFTANNGNRRVVLYAHNAAAVRWLELNVKVGSSGPYDWQGQAAHYTSPTLLSGVDCCLPDAVCEVDTSKDGVTLTAVPECAAQFANVTGGGKFIGFYLDRSGRTEDLDDISFPIFSTSSTTDYTSLSSLGGKPYTLSVGPSEKKMVAPTPMFNDWRFLTVRPFGEAVDGYWTLQVRDAFFGGRGSISSWSLLLNYEAPLPIPPSPSPSPSPFPPPSPSPSPVPTPFPSPNPSPSPTPTLIPSPTPSPTPFLSCAPGTCNVCDSCCKSYLANAPDSCIVCVDSLCTPAPTAPLR